MRFCVEIIDFCLAHTQGPTHIFEMFIFNFTKYNILVVLAKHVLYVVLKIQNRQGGYL